MQCTTMCAVKNMSRCVKFCLLQQNMPQTVSAFLPLKLNTVFGSRLWTREIIYLVINTCLFVIFMLFTICLVYSTVIQYPYWMFGEI